MSPEEKKFILDLAGEEVRECPDTCNSDPDKMCNECTGGDYWDRMSLTSTNFFKAWDELMVKRRGILDRVQVLTKVDYSKKVVYIILNKGNVIGGYPEGKVRVLETRRKVIEKVAFILTRKRGSSYDFNTKIQF